MRCYLCDTVVDGESICPNCGADITLYRQILKFSEIYYNKGLEQANIRDLSGAIESLQIALRYNKEHREARNLLGLVYFEVGEAVRALEEWVISKHFNEDNPLADKYLNEIQNTPGMLNKLDQTSRKYNQALLYCNQGSRDLAIIQLRKVLNLNPKFVAGHQLLALLYIQDHKYNDARKELSAASKIDARNLITLRYNKEVKECLKEQNQNKKKKKDDIVSIKDGNDIVMMPESGFREMLDATQSSIINIIFGIVIGLLVCFFLVVPTVRQETQDESTQSLLAVNEELSSATTQVSQLERQVENLESELEVYTGQSDIVTSYEQLIIAKDAYDAEDLEATMTAIDLVNRDVLSESGQLLYDTIYAEVYPEEEEGEETDETDGTEGADGEGSGETAGTEGTTGTTEGAETGGTEGIETGTTEGTETAGTEGVATE